MSIVPQKSLERLEFYETHVDPWTTNAVAIGITSAAATAISVACGNTRTAYKAALAARQASKTATQAFHDELAALHTLGMQAIELIKHKAQSTNDPSVYTLAEIPAPATPSALPPPGTPFDFRVGIEQGGAISLKWKCQNPKGSQGTLYEVRRQAQGAPAGSWVFAGATGKREFLDTTLPSSLAATGVNYEVVGVRSSTRGVAAIFSVRFGVSGGGGAGGTGGFTVESVTPMGLAA